MSRIAPVIDSEYEWYRQQKNSYRNCDYHYHYSYSCYCHDHYHSYCHGYGYYCYCYSCYCNKVCPGYG